MNLQLHVYCIICSRPGSSDGTWIRHVMVAVVDVRLCQCLHLPRLDLYLLVAAAGCLS